MVIIIISLVVATYFHFILELIACLLTVNIELAYIQFFLNHATQTAFEHNSWS